MAILGCGGALAIAACTWIDPLDDITQPRPDAGTDARFCDSQDASFCEDFDQVTSDVQGPRWSDKLLFQGTLARESPADAPSAPTVLVASVTVVDSSANIKAILFRDFDVVPDEVHLEHEWRMNSAPSDGGVKLSVITLGDYELELDLLNDTIGLKECYTEMPCVEPSHVALPSSADPWRRVRIDLVKGKDGGAGSIELWDNGKSLWQGFPGQSGDAAADFAQGKLRLNVGIFYSGSTERIEYAFDNVVLNYR
jgi:hypothetical protein